MLNKPCCIDIYRGDEVQDAVGHPLVGFNQVKASGVFALIHKATEYTQYRDSRYDARREYWMTGAPIAVTDVDGKQLELVQLWGGYHFFHGSDPKGEAANFIMTARLGAQDMPFLDWEAVGASGYQPTVEAADEFCQRVEQALGQPCGVYGGNVPRERFAAEHPADAVLERFRARPLWFCAYGGVQNLEHVPAPWEGQEKAPPAIFLWQDDGDKYGPGPHTVPGMIGYCDNSTVVDPMTFQKLHDAWLKVKPADSAAPSA
jgi:GH25 family lysozyme M1 (1,4-beta-N-acetylmuramidase)